MTRISWPHTLCGAALILWLFVGMGSQLMNSVPSVGKIGLVSVWFVIAAARSHSFLGRVVTTSWPILGMLLISVVYAPEVAQGVQYTQGFEYLLIAYALLCFYAQAPFRRERHILVGIMAADFVITGIRTFIALQADPLLARYLGTTEEIREQVYGSQRFPGVGGYGYAYSLGAVILVLLFFCVRSHMSGILLVPVIVAGVVVLFEMAYATAILLVLLFGTVFLAQDLIRRRELRVFIYVAIFSGWIVGIYATILSALAAQGWVTGNVQDRLLEVAALLSGTVSPGSDIEGRSNLWGDSVDIFIHNAPFGLAGSGQLAQETGGHSGWLDLLASYGVYAFLPVLFLVLAWKLSRGSGQVETVPIRRTWVYFVLLGFVNTIFYSTIVLTWMFFIPGLVSFLGQRSAHRERNAPMEVPA